MPLPDAVTMPTLGAAGARDFRPFQPHHPCQRADAKQSAVPKLHTGRAAAQL